MGAQPARAPARERLLDAADRLFYGNGISSTGVDSVLAEAGVSVATLYAQFGSKEGLLEASLQRRLGSWRECWDSTIEAAASDEERLLAVFDALHLFRQAQGNARWCAFLATAAETQAAGTRISELIEADTSLLTERLRNFAKPLADAGADQLAEAILLIYNGTLASFLRDSPTHPIEAGRNAASAVIRGFQGRASRQR